jgi:hypothetical protein
MKTFFTKNKKRASIEARFEDFLKEGSFCVFSFAFLFVRAIKVEKEREAQRVFKRVTLISRNQVCEVKPEYIIAETGADCEELAVAFSRCLVEVSSADRKLVIRTSIQYQVA